MTRKASKLGPLLILSGVGNAVGYFNCGRYILQNVMFKWNVTILYLVVQHN